MTARQTRQKQALAEVLEESGAFRSAQDLHAELRARGRPVGLTTVYAQLRVLAEQGSVDTVVSGEGETLYRRCASTRHHHHLVCRGCGATVEVEGPEVERWAAKVAARHRFTDISHTVEVDGVCAACSQSRAAALSTASAPPGPAPGSPLENRSRRRVPSSGKGGS